MTNLHTDLFSSTATYGEHQPLSHWSGQLRKSLFMRINSSSSFNKWQPMKFYHLVRFSNEEPPRFACFKVKTLLVIVSCKGVILMRVGPHSPPVFKIHTQLAPTKAQDTNFFFIISIHSCRDSHSISY